VNAVVLYWSKTGNTEKVASAVEKGLKTCGVAVDMFKLPEGRKVDFYAYDLVCVGFPSYQWMPPKPVDAFIKEKFNHYKKQGRVKNASPPLPGKHALIFCTYSGPHTGIREAVPAGLYAGQFFEHLGFTVLDEWYIIGEFHGSGEYSTQGRLGDIRGRPNAEDLQKVEDDTISIVRRIETRA
jgi:hypothetical protein